jgi:hypothetical protein
LNNDELISVLALTVSMFFVAISIWNARRARVRAVQPVLVFQYDSTEGWLLQNVGNGPAIDVVVAERLPGHQWAHPVRIPPLSRDGRFRLRWLDHTNVTQLGVACSDADGQHYSSVCARDRTTIQRGRCMPTWSDDEIGVHWNPPARLPGHPENS